MAEQVEQERATQVSIHPTIRLDLPAIEKILRNTVQTPYWNGDVEEDEVLMELERINKALDSIGEGQVLMAKDEQNGVIGKELTTGPRYISIGSGRFYSRRG